MEGAVEEDDAVGKAEKEEEEEEGLDVLREGFVPV